MFRPVAMLGIITLTLFPAPAADPVEEAVAELTVEPSDESALGAGAVIVRGGQKGGRHRRRQRH